MSCKIQCEKFRHEPETYSFRLEFKASKKPEKPTRFSPEQLTVFLESLQLLYNHACEKFNVMPHQLRILAFKFPAGVLTFHGLKDPAGAVACALETAPDVIADVARNDSNRKDVSAAHATYSDHQHLDVLKKIISDLDKIKRPCWKSYIQYTLASELGAHVALTKHITVTPQKKAEQTARAGKAGKAKR